MKAGQRVVSATGKVGTYMAPAVDGGFHYVEWDDQPRPALAFDGEFRRYSFWDFTFRRSGFGFTSWTAAIAIHALAITIGVIAALDHGIEWYWRGTTLVVCCAVIAGIWYGTWSNYRGTWR